MDVTVLQFAHSPFCIPVTAALSASGIRFTTREVSNADRSEILRLTNGEYYQVPLLIHGERIVFESGSSTQNVARYVDKEFAAGRLFPEHLEGLQATVIDYLENDVECVTFRLVNPFYLDTIEDVAERGMIVRHKERKFGRGCIDAWRRDAATLRAEADRLLDRFETTLRHSAFLFGEAPVYSDFLLLGIIGNLTYKDWNKLHPDEQPALLQWQARMRAFRWNEPEKA